MQSDPRLIAALDFPSEEAAKQEAAAFIEQIDKDEIEKLTEDMSRIISFADTINNAADEGVDFDNINNLSNVLREDEVIPSYDREKILRNAKDSDEGCFLVKNIMK